MIGDLARNPSDDQTTPLSVRYQNEIDELSSACCGFSHSARRGSADAR
jgi:hypothetical protein